MRRLRAPLRADPEIFGSAGRRCARTAASAKCRSCCRARRFSSRGRGWYITDYAKKSGTGTEDEGATRQAATDAKDEGHEAVTEVEARQSQGLEGARPKSRSSSTTIGFTTRDDEAPPKRRRRELALLFAVLTVVRRSMFSERRYARNGSPRSGRLSAK